ncbi:ACP S-malonyltransferase [Candidatus Woesearchaeota archaeon]|nr:ACP S-malonyltransferase [Candidatus Woesearchaeota archaeon]
MTKTALIFRGQPAQYAGMGIDLSNNFQLAREVYGYAERQIRGTLYSDALSFCFDPKRTATAEANRNTLLAHAALYTTNNVLYSLLVEKCSELGVPLEFQAMAGHSLGQLNAFAAAGAIGFEDALSIALEGGEQLHQFSQQEASGGMAAIFYGTQDFDRHLEHLTQNEVYVAIHNAPGMVVIGGLESNLNRALEYLKSKKDEGIFPHRIGKIEGPFHTVHVKPAIDRIKPRIDSIPYTDSTVPVYANTTGNIILNADGFMTETYEQGFNLVNWANTILNMTRDGVTRFVVIDPERMPEKSIAETIKATSPTAEILVVSDFPSLESVVRELTAANPLQDSQSISVP